MRVLAVFLTGVSVGPVGRHAPDASTPDQVKLQVVRTRTGPGIENVFATP